MDFEKILLKDIVPADYNPRVMSEEEFNHLKDSIGEFGLVDPIIINLKNNHIIGGHQRYDVFLEQYKDELDGFEFNLIRLGDVGWCFTDTDLNVKDENHEKALNVALNKISGDWDESKLTGLFDELKVTGFDLSLTGFDKQELTSLYTDVWDDVNITEDIGEVIDEDDNEKSNKNDSGNDNNVYTSKINIPQYEITGKKPKLEELVKTDKVYELQDKINNSNLSDDVKQFLIYASYRFLEFHYGNIAEYYAHGDKELQEIMEDLALVIIDFDKAISGGFVEFSERMKEIIKRDYGDLVD